MRGRTYTSSFSVRIMLGKYTARLYVWHFECELNGKKGADKAKEFDRCNFDLVNWMSRGIIHAVPWPPLCTGATVDSRQTRSPSNRVGPPRLSIFANDAVPHGSGKSRKSQDTALPKAVSAVYVTVTTHDATNGWTHLRQGFCGKSRQQRK